MGWGLLEAQPLLLWLLGAVTAPQALPAGSSFLGRALLGALTKQRQGGSAGAFSLAAEGSGSAASQPESMVWCYPDIPIWEINWTAAPVKEIQIWGF